MEPPITVSFLHCTEPQSLWPADYMLVMPLQGEVCLSGSESQSAASGTVLFTTPACGTPVRADAGADLLHAGIPTDFFETFAGTPQCPPAIILQENCGELAERLAELFDLQYNHTDASFLDQYTSACLLLQALTRLISSASFSPVRPDSGTGRKQQMLQWMEQNYRKPIQLQNFADAFHLSRQHISAVFHQETGRSFSDCLLDLRLTEARKLLRTTDQTIANVAAASGFPSAKSFHKAFQDAFQMTPGAYRQQVSRISPDAAADTHDILTANRLLQTHRLLYSKQESTIHITESVSVQHFTDFQPVWRDILNADSCTVLLQPAAQKQLAEIQNEMHFSFIRLSNLHEDGIIDYYHSVRQFRYTGFIALLDFLKSTGLTPMLALGSSWLIPLDVCILKNDGYSLYADLWLQFLRELLRVSIGHWGTAWVSTWRFEFYMPATLYGSADPAAFFDLFTASVKVIREVLPEAQIGGPALPVDNAHMARWNDWFRGLSENHLQPDFISAELWADAIVQEDQLPGLYDDQPLETYLVTALQNADAALAVQKAQQIRDMMQRYGYGDRKFYIAALGITKYHALPAQIGGHCAAYLTKCAIELQPLADGIGCWKALNAEAEYTDEISLLSEGCGLMDRHSLRYPAWYAYQFLAALYPGLIFRGVSGCITTDGGGRYAVLLQNCKNYAAVFCRDYTEPAVLEFQDPQLYTDYSALQESLTLTDLPPNRYRVTRYLAGDHHGCLAWTVQQLGAYDPADSTLLTWLAGQSLPCRQSQLEACTGELTLQIRLEPNEVMLLCIEPEEKA